ncbi:S-protein homolog 24-like [Apium graveolens]|uniref:S-protein homolog 24-like n=1 Tax=Apium graveolens TaxID=4045 RepID=UPI003D790C5B
MASITDQILALLIIFLIIFPSSLRSDSVEVYLDNELYQSPNLTVHCQSNTKKDLGTKIMADGTSISWLGDINVPGENEIWSCAMNTGKLNGVFDIFESNRDNTRCGDVCEWMVNEDGIYWYSPPDHNFVFQFSWPH